MLRGDNAVIIDVIEQNIADISLELLKILLADKTTGGLIKWATDNYQKFGDEYSPEHEILPNLIIGKNTHTIQPRVSKTQIEQAKRTRDKAEVFTPSWVCNQQNNLIDAAWFGREDIFNRAEGHTWKATKGFIHFPEGKTWQQYVDTRCLEVCCGEAPYLVSRYDTVSGRFLPIETRIGLLDRKLRVVGENTVCHDDWCKWALRSFQSIYGYEYQGDNVLLARENLLYTFIENYIHRFDQKPSLRLTKKFANVISWNIWQMDGLTMLPPHLEEESMYDQLMIPGLEVTNSAPVSLPCKVYDWRANCSIEFQSMVKEGGNCG